MNKAQVVFPKYPTTNNEVNRDFMLMGLNYLRTLCKQNFAYK